MRQEISNKITEVEVENIGDFHDSILIEIFQQHWNEIPECPHSWEYIVKSIRRDF
jgi:hypothetical protein